MAVTLALSNLKYVGAIVGVANLIGFGATSIFATHKITDLVGVGSFVAATIGLSLRNRYSPHSNLRLFIANTAVALWGARLSSFLFYRVVTLGEDKRLEAFFRQKDEGFLDASRSLFPVKLASFWAIQASWGIICMIPITLLNSVPPLLLGPLSYISTGGIIAGFLLEAIADWQKYTYKQANKNHWCDVGLWSLSRHPNYGGELLFWWSIYSLCAPALGAKHAVLSLASPLFITSIILFLSGIPILEKVHQERYGSSQEYQQYKNKTNLLFPFPRFFGGQNPNNNHEF